MAPQSSLTQSDFENIWSPIGYISALHWLLDGGLTAVPTAAQAVYMQFFRHSYGRSRARVRMSIDDLRNRTGLSRDRCVTALRTLRQTGLLELIDKGRPRSASVYLVFLEQRKKTAPDKVKRCRRIRPSNKTGSVESRLLDVIPSDRADLEISWINYPKKERLRIKQQVHDILVRNGFTADETLFTQAVLFQFIKETMFERFKKSYPHWFMSGETATEPIELYHW